MFDIDSSGSESLICSESGLCIKPSEPLFGVSLSSFFTLSSILHDCLGAGA